MKPFLTIYILLFCTYCYSQYINVFSDYFHGGVTGSGFNALVSSGQIDLNIPTGSTIKKAYLFASATRLKDFNDFPADINLSINNQNVALSMNNSLNNNYTVNLGNQPIFLELKTIVKDITNLNIYNINNLVMPIQDYYEGKLP
jgi:hypothetical protein